MEISEILMNPVRQRIVQYLMIHKKGTVKEIKNELFDVPSASLYRHVKILADNSVIKVVEENRIRGTVESVYSLNKSAIVIDDEGGASVQMVLIGICIAFAKYFSGGHADPQKDMLLATSCTLTLTDDEFKGFLTEINEVATKYMSKTVTEGSILRQVTLVSSPVNQ